MPYVSNQGVRIYYEIEGSGPPIVLAHGISGSLEDWREVGWVESLRDRYRLILVDARGHGRSDKPHDPGAYRRGEGPLSRIFDGWNRRPGRWGPRPGAVPVADDGRHPTLCQG